MPTGYTADIVDGTITDLPDFLTQIARAFVMDLRDEPSDTPIPRVSRVQAHGIQWSGERYKETLDEIHRLNGLTASQLDAEAKADFDKETANWERRMAGKRQARERCDQMLARVAQWDAPPRMQGMKDFAIEQLEQTREFDGCLPDPKSEFDRKPELLDGQAWFEAKMNELQHSAQYHAKEKAGAEDRYRDWSAFYSTIVDEIDRLRTAAPAHDVTTSES